MIRPTEIEARDNYSIWLRYSDQSEGIVDLSDLIEKGVFRKLKDRDIFKAVYISDSGSIAWEDEIELCPDSLYMKITGKKAEEVLPGLESLSADA